MTTIRRLLAIAWERLHDHGSPGIAGCCGCGRPSVKHLTSVPAATSGFETWCRICGPQGRLFWTFTKPMRSWPDEEFDELVRDLGAAAVR